MLPGVGEIRVRRGANIRYLRIRMAPGRGVWVSVPYGVGRTQVMRFLEENRNWILENRQKVQEYERQTGAGLKVGAEIRTRLHVLKIEETGQREVSYRIEGRRVTVFVPKNVSSVPVEKMVRQFLIEIYTLECRQFLPQRVKAHADQYGFRYGKLSFRNNVSNWGSCSAANDISLNIKLMKLPDELIDYVILHELCHTVEKNHAPAFWKLVGQVCPDYAKLRARLRQYHTGI